MHAPQDIDRLIERIREESTRPEYNSPLSEPLVPLAPSDVAAAALGRDHASPPKRARAASVDDLLLILDPEQFLGQAYQALLRRPADVDGIAHHRPLIDAYGQPFVLCALRASPEGRVFREHLPGFGLAPLFHGFWRLGRRVRLAKVARFSNRVYHRWRHLKLTLNGRLFTDFTDQLRQQASQGDRLGRELRDVASQHTRDLADHARDLADHARDLADHARDLANHSSDLANHSSDLADHTRDLAEQGQRQAVLTDQLEAARADINLLRARLKVLQQRGDPVPMPAPRRQTADQALTERMDAFYLAFEEVLRGEEGAIAAGLTHYLQDLAELPETLLNKPIIDLGCGRGEWLRLLLDNGFDAIGVDLNPDMAAYCNKRGLKVHCTDALTHLAGLPDDSQAVITGFHIIEHLAFPLLFQFLEQAWRVLAPGGRLILETPNPENLLVGSHTFYHDFSHRHPVTPTALRFLLGYHGFADIRPRRLHPYPASARVATDTDLGERINGHLYGPQDYAMIAVKPLIPKDSGIAPEASAPE